MKVGNQIERQRQVGNAQAGSPVARQGGVFVGGQAVDKASTSGRIRPASLQIDPPGGRRSASATVNHQAG